MQIMFTLLWSWSIWSECNSLYFLLSVHMRYSWKERQLLTLRLQKATSIKFSSNANQSVCQLWDRSLLYHVLHKFTVLLKLCHAAFKSHQTWFMSTCRHHVSSLFLALCFPAGCVGRDFQMSLPYCQPKQYRKRVVTLLMHCIHYT